MIKILPFKAVRPPRSKANLVASRPIYTYKKHHLRAKLQGNPFTFLHVVNPDFLKGEKAEPNSIERFNRVKQKYTEFKKLDFLIKDKKDSFYIYEQDTPFGNFIGIIAGASVEDYKKGTIKVHENTLTKRELMFKDYLDICKFHAEPVLLTYPDNNKIDSVVNKYTKLRSEYEYTTTDLRAHKLWLVNNKKDIQSLKRAFEEINDIYIADGHHRVASSKLYSDSKDPDNEVAHYFLSYFISESKLKIFDYNRFISSIGEQSIDEFLDKISKNFKIKLYKRKVVPRRKHEISMYINKTWYLLTVKKDIVDENHPTKSLDTQILSDLILSSILDIQNLKTDERVKFYNGAKGYRNLIKLVNDNENSVAFILYPHTVKEIKKVADTNNIMPPKSTWIEPKMRSALTIYEYL